MASNNSKLVLFEECVSSRDESQSSVDSGFMRIDSNKAGSTWMSEEEPPEGGFIPFDDLFHMGTHTHLFVVAVLCISCGTFSYMLIDWNDLVGMWVTMGLLFVQLIWAVDKLPFLRIRTQDYMDSSISLISATLEETIGDQNKSMRSRSIWQRVFCCCCAAKKGSYVVQYSAPSAIHGRPVVVRKTLWSGVWDDDLSSSENGFVEVTRLWCKDGEPFSAYPRHVIEDHHARYKTWVLYFLPLLLLTVVVVAYNIWYTNDVVWGNHIKYLPAIFHTYGTLAVVILLPLICYVGKFTYHVQYGGEESSSDGAVVVDVATMTA
eukprot:CAMPEP_0119006166 /NCGR_PEP_ID=MMETSP1176-20130426/2147_1 /TAXON_ID=265551 /ORGANISM="Synedropsis recta cf, Strain CCMP1620" /LENGTH=319 /DNA_ID=CAMNT_0006958055 /DNA_START=105 /DNA_END=1064 /DNA_ORIENTATION=+